MTGAEFGEFVKSLKPGDRVVETKTWRKGRKGVVYVNDKGHVCVMWDDQMGTAVTWGTRRLEDYDASA